MSARYLIGNAIDVVRTLDDGSIDLALSSPPYLSLRSYLPADDPNKAQEMGAEATPADFVDALLDLVEAIRPKLAPHASLAFELGDSFSGSGGAGGDYNADGMRDGQAPFAGTAATSRHATNGRDWPKGGANLATRRERDGWPLDRSLCMVPELFRIALVYGFNPLNSRPTPRWRVRNVVRHFRPNPPVGSLADKVRPATSEWCIAMAGDKRYFDLDSVRTTPVSTYEPHGRMVKRAHVVGENGYGHMPEVVASNPAGAPPLDWWDDDDLEWRDAAGFVAPTSGYAGKVSTSRRVPCGPHDGGERTTSPGCPVHGDQPGRAPMALRDARAGTSENHTSHNGGHPARGLFDGSVPTGAILDRSGSVQPSTLGCAPPDCSPSATSRSKASRKTDLSPGTSPSDTPSAESPVRTDDTSASPELSGPRHDTPWSTLSEAEPGRPSGPQTAARTEDTSHPPVACSCSFWKTKTESTSHYATFSPKVIRRLIDPMCPRQVCLVCGVPSERTHSENPDYEGRAGGPTNNNGQQGSSLKGFSHKAYAPSKWTPGGWSCCGHGEGCKPTTWKVVRTAKVDEEGLPVLGKNGRPKLTSKRVVGDVGECAGNHWRPGLVLDPFGGSGTTGMVATGMGRDALLIDIDERNLDLARERIGMFMVTG